MSSEGIARLVAELRDCVANYDCIGEAADELEWQATALVAQEAEIAELTELLAQADSFLEAERSLVAKLDGETAALRTALAKLANEVAGLKATEFKVRNVIGDTNWNVLMLRETEARATLKDKNDGQ